jgi:ribosomal protein S12 methylthiotransferase accessory factor
MQPVLAAHLGDIVEGLHVAPEQIQSLFSRYGITRIADYRGMDRLQVPIWGCIRPASHTVAVCFGKGLDEKTAKISALMEALESACAENREFLVKMRASVDETTQQGVPIINLQNISQCNFEKMQSGHALDWVKGTSLTTGDAVFGPYGIVGLDYELEDASFGGLFHPSSIGLAAGKTWQDAVCHALLEIVENDAVALLTLFPSLHEQLPTGVCPKGVSESLDLALEWFDTTGIVPVFSLVSQEFGLPVVKCEVSRFENLDTQSGPHSFGFACRGTIADAALAALLECAQTRMTVITGAREDLQWRHYSDEVSQPPTQAPHKFASFFVNNNSSFDAKPRLELILDNLVKGGITGLSAFTLSQPDDPVHVVRVLAEGLDSANGETKKSLGRREIAALLKISAAMP